MRAVCGLQAWDQHRKRYKASAQAVKRIRQCKGCCRRLDSRVKKSIENYSKINSVTFHCKLTWSFQPCSVSKSDPLISRCTRIHAPFSSLSLREGEGIGLGGGGGLGEGLGEGVPSGVVAANFKIESPQVAPEYISITTKYCWSFSAVNATLASIPSSKATWAWDCKRESLPSVRWRGSGFCAVTFTVACTWSSKPILPSPHVKSK